MKIKKNVVEEESTKKKLLLEFLSLLLTLVKSQISALYYKVTVFHRSITQTE